MLFETERLIVREAEDADIPRIIYLEEHPENRNYLWIGTVEEHKAEILDPNHILCVFEERNSKEIVGYALIRLDFHSNIFELRRIAIDRKGEGFGRESMVGIIRYAFEQTETNRLWLDVYPANLVGIRLYESLGMHRDGILRENYLSERGYLNQIIYSVLRAEYESGKLIL